MSNAIDQAAIERIAAEIHSELLEQALGRPLEGALSESVELLVDRRAGVLSMKSRSLIAERIMQRAMGAGPLQPLLGDPEVDEILVSGTRPVWVERRGRLSMTELKFASEEDLRLTIERMLAPAGRRVDEAEPLCDARLPDGSRINVVLPPLAVDGPTLTIRRFRPRGFTAEQLVELGSWSPQLTELLAKAVTERRNILISGGTGSGKTTTLAAIAGLFGDHERVITIEDTAELRLAQSHLVRLETRPASIEGRGEVTIRMLVRNALRMRPDRLIVGEVRGAEALDMLSALSTGHDGSLTTIHAGSPTEALRRLETLALMADVGLPHRAIRAQVAAAIDLVVHQVRSNGGQRRVTRVDEVSEVDGVTVCEPLYSDTAEER